jgi:hypothetical protein
MRSYVVRGQITTVFEAVPDRPRELEIHHEAIPEFINYSGKQVGMAAMTMPFRVRKGLDLARLAVGDKVEFTMAVDWERKPPGQITAILELPADTPLSFESK